jgi:hypothetical protein
MEDQMMITIASKENERDRAIQQSKRHLILVRSFPFIHDQAIVL